MTVFNKFLFSFICDHTSGACLRSSSQIIAHYFSCPSHTQIGECVAIQEEKAGRFFTGRLMARVFTAWRDHTEEEKVAMWHKERKAREHNP